MPDFEQVHQQYKDKVILFGLDVGPFVGLGSREEGKKLIEELRVTYPAGTTFDAGVVREYSILGMPTTVFIEPERKIVKKWTGTLNKSKMTELIEELLAISALTPVPTTTPTPLPTPTLSPPTTVPGSVEFPPIRLDPRIPATPTLVSPESKAWIENAHIAFAQDRIEYFGQQEVSVSLEPPDTTGNLLVTLRYPRDQLCGSAVNLEQTLWDGPSRNPSGIVKRNLEIPGPFGVALGPVWVTVTRKSDSKKLTEAAFQIVSADPPKVQIELGMFRQVEQFKQGDRIGLTLWIKPTTRANIKSCGN
jgi:hypothetical protein